jgi:WD40 repeat protein/serine/threonine protein kinase
LRVEGIGKPNDGNKFFGANGRAASLYQMMGKQQNEVRAVFIEALALATADERARYLDAACRDKPGLRQRVEALLSAREHAGEFLAQDALGGNLDCDPAITEGPGTVIGRYKLLEQIGEGGFGVVFMAEQLEPIRRRVALKIVKPGMDTKQVIARFEAERQALALMDHPNIAKIFDAGVTGAPSPQVSTLNSQLHFGRPYFVMELVHGVPLTEFCDANDSTPQERLQLFIQVCHAVQHAHQKGIIHRDLKPSNILVTLHDGKPVPKVIDFGTAKALQHSLTEKTLFTAYGKLIGTPQYMSPEQAELSGLDVDTRADIYALGVLLYELLTGTTPFEAEQLRTAAFEEMLRIIRQEEPPKPSTRVSTLGARATEIARHRQVDPDLLQRSLRGDLDWIVMKALEKDRARRYETASALVEDLQHHLNHEPVLASPPSVAYRARKFVLRHRVGVAMGAVVTVALVAGAVVSTWQAVRATRAEREQSRLRQAAEIARQQIEGQAYASDMSLAAQSANSGANLGSVQNLLSRWQNRTPDRRGWEWYYLNGLCHREILAIEVATDEALSVAWSPDGGRLASAGGDGKVRIWNASTGRKIKELHGPTELARSLAWSPDGKRLATSSRDNTVLVWDPEASEVVLTLTGHSGIVRKVAWSRDGTKLASVSPDKMLKIWDAATGAEVLTVPLGEPLHSVSWHPDGTRLAVCAELSTVVLDLVTGERLLRLRHALTVSWSPDGKWLATGDYESKARITDVATGTEVIVGRHGGAVFCVAWSPDGTLLASTSAGDGTVKVGDARTGAEVHSFRGHAGAVVSVSWRPDGTQIASGGTDGTVKVWDISRGDPRLTIKTQPEDQVMSLAWHPDARQLASSGSEGSIRIWDTASTRDPILLNGHTSWVWQVAWNPSGARLASAGCGGLIQIWEPPSVGGQWSRQAYTKAEDEREVRSLAWSPDGKRLASVAQNGRLKIYDTSAGALLISHAPQGFGSYAAAWSPDGKHLAMGVDKWKLGEIQILDATSGQLQRALRGHKDSIRSLAWSPNGKRLASASDDTTARIWDAETGRELYTLVGHANEVRSVAWSPDGTRLASGSCDRTVRIWDPASGWEVCSLAESIRTKWVFAVAWSPDGTRIASGDIGGTILIHDATPGRAAEEKRKRAESEQAEKGTHPTVPPR